MRDCGEPVQGGAHRGPCVVHAGTRGDMRPPIYVFRIPSVFSAAKRVLMGVHAHGCSHARATERGLETVVRIFQPCACPEPNLGLRPK